MDEPLFVKPARPGLIVRQPEHGGAPIPEEGALVPPTTYWRRQLKVGDVVIAKRPDRAAAKGA